MKTQWMGPTAFRIVYVPKQTNSDAVFIGKGWHTGLLYDSWKLLVGHEQRQPRSNGFTVCSL